MSSPWLKFYPSDWRADPALRMCSIAARGLWMEMLCLMHEAEPRGSLLINGLAVSERQLASLAGIPLKEATTLLQELESAGVFSREDNGTIYSRRMRRDDAKAARDKANGRGGGNPNLKRGVNPPSNHEDKAQKPEARSQIEESLAQHSTTEVRGCAALPDLELELRRAAGLEGDAAGWIRNTAPIAALIAEGFDLEADILPVVRAKAADGYRISSWKALIGAIRDARKVAGPKPTELSKPVPEVFVAKDSDGWQAWVRHETSQGRKPPIALQTRNGIGRAMPSAFPPS